MQCPFRPSHNTGGRGHVIRRKRRIIGFACDGYSIEEPVDLESIGIKRVLRDLPRHINEQRVINVKRLAGKWEQAGEYGRGKKYVVNALVREAFGRRRHRECSQTRCA